MNVTDYSTIFSLTILFTQVPLYLVWIAGIAWAVYHWSKHPKVSLIAVIVLAGNLMLACANTILPGMLYLYIPSAEDVPTIIMVMRGGSTAIQIGLWVALLVALFGWRVTTDE